jgi:hypothetical protein
MGRDTLLSILVAVATAACSDASTVSRSIGKLVREQGAKELRLAEVTDFQWEQVYLFGPYAPRTSVCNTLGVQAKYCERVVPFESTDDGEMSLAFLAEGRVVRYVPHSRWNGDFTPVPTAQPLARANAIFRVVQDGAATDGKPWLRLLRK